MRKWTFVGCLCVWMTLSVSAQRQPEADSLPRRGWFGVALGPHEGGAAVTAVVAGSTAAAEGIRVGDVIHTVDERPVRAPGDVVAAMGRHVGGETVVLDVVRDGRTERRSVVLRSLPHETMTGATVDYGSVMLDDGSRLRTIVTVPQSPEGRRPAVLLLQGGGCGSMDVPMAPDVAQPGLMRSIGAQGYVTMRVEKSGVGDSQGPPCDAIGYAEELAGYRAALAALKRHPSVDPERIFVVGISLGGVFAPILANESPVRGIVVYGTLGSAPSPYPGRSERFFREFASADIKGAWSAVSAQVLVLHGQFDENVAVIDHTQIAPWVNARRPGAATHRILEGLDHCWTRHASMDESRGRCGAGQATPALQDAILKFLRTLS
jgi:dienelactone hydrolase